MLDVRMAVFAITLAVIAAGCSTGDAPPALVNRVATDSPSAAASAVMPYVLENTEVRELVADGLGRTYPVLVSVSLMWRCKSEDIAQEACPKSCTCSGSSVQDK